MNALTAPLLDAPDLPEIVDALQARLAAERADRRRFVADLTPSRKAEFINGEVVAHSPAKVRHIDASDNALRLISLYALPRGLGRVLHEKALVRFPRNDYEPDVCWFAAARAALIEPDQHLLPVPDLIVEVLSPSTAALDRGIKFRDYARHGVSEYWIVDPEAETVEVYRRDEATAAYPAAPRLAGGDLVRSTALAGLQFPAAALFDPAAHLAVLRDLASPE